MKKTVAILALLAAAGAAQASISTFVVAGTATFNGVATREAQGNALNDTGIAIGLNPGGLVNAVRMTGNMTMGVSGTFASEARVRFTPGAGNTFAPFSVQHSTVGGYTGTIAINRTQAVTAFTLGAGSDINFEWWESFQDDSTGLAESTLDVTYEFGANTITNGNFNLGSLNGNGSTLVTPGSHVAGGLDFFTFAIADGVDSLGESLNIKMLAGTSGTSMTDPEIGLYDGAGNLVATNDDSIGLFSQLNFADSGLVPGNYTLVTGGFNTVFPTTLGGTFTAGTNAGTYSLEMTYTVPAPGAAALLGLGGLIAGRRRRA